MQRVLVGLRNRASETENVGLGRLTIQLSPLQW